MSAFQANHQSTPSSLLATASAIVAASKLPLGDDHHAVTVEIVAQALGTLDADNLSNFVKGGSDPATAAQIVYAALETEASGADDEATVGPSVSVMPLLTSGAAKPNPDAASMEAILTMIREIMVPMAERMVAQEVEMVEINARLARVEARAVGAISF